MDFLHFIREQAQKPTKAGDVARAIEIEIVDEGRGPRTMEYLLFEEAEEPGAYQGVKDLWSLWQERKKQPA